MTSPAMLANLQQITLAGMRVGELSREIRRSVAIGDGVAVARDAATLAVTECPPAAALRNGGGQ